MPARPGLTDISSEQLGILQASNRQKDVGVHVEWGGEGSGAYGGNITPTDCQGDDKEYAALNSFPGKMNRENIYYSFGRQATSAAALGRVPVTVAAKICPSDKPYLSNRGYCCQATADPDAPSPESPKPPPTPLGQSFKLVPEPAQLDDVYKASMGVNAHYPDRIPEENMTGSQELYNKYSQKMLPHKKKEVNAAWDKWG